MSRRGVADPWGDPRSYGPSVWADVARRIAAEEGHPDPDLFVCQREWESDHWAEDVIACRRASPAGAQGIAQYMPATAAEDGVDPCNPTDALRGAARRMRRLYERYDDWTAALAAYNAGPGNLARYGLEGVLGDDFAGGETQRYVQAICRCRGTLPQHRRRWYRDEEGRVGAGRALAGGAAGPGHR